MRNWRISPVPTSQFDPLRHQASGMNRDQMYDIAEAKVVAEHKGGRLLKDIDRQQGVRTDTTSVHAGPKFTGYQQALHDAGLADTTAKRWQIMALVPEEDLHAYFATQRDKGKDITYTDVYRMSVLELRRAGRSVRVASQRREQGYLAW